MSKVEKKLVRGYKLNKKLERINQAKLDGNNKITVQLFHSSFSPRAKFKLKDKLSSFFKSAVVMESDNDDSSNAKNESIVKKSRSDNAKHKRITQVRRYDPTISKNANQQSSSSSSDDSDTDSSIHKVNINNNPIFTVTESSWIHPDLKSVEQSNTEFKFGFGPNTQTGIKAI
ncbi:hypothetical protein GJ496_005344 [Pomphorhynchus laevis]|nr:hypothetical protein GJ496_005344 [Pomphorhynchus laevis]